MRFFDNGRMLYSLDTIEPEDMAKHLAPATETPKKIFEGSYTLVGKNVHVEVSSMIFFLITQSYLSPSFYAVTSLYYILKPIYSATYRLLSSNSLSSSIMPGRHALCSRALRTFNP